MIASRELVIKALENRFKHQENGEMPGRLLHELGERQSMDCDLVKAKGFYTEVGVVSFYHEGSIDKANQRRIKKAWPVRAYDIPYWGRAVDIRKLWK